MVHSPYLCGVTREKSKLKHALSGALPGWEAQRKMINFSRPRAEDVETIDPGANRGAVLILIYPKDGEDHVVLILRNTYDGVHSGQVGLPGGKVEKSDRDLMATALREAHEEVGILPAEVEILGGLSPVYIPPSRFLVYPYVGISEKRPDFQRDPTEVAKIIEAPVEKFLDPAYRKEKTIFVNSEKTELAIKYFDIQDQVVWGATAMIMSEFSEIVKNTRGL